MAIALHSGLSGGRGTTYQGCAVVERPACHVGGVGIRYDIVGTNGVTSRS